MSHETGSPFSSRLGTTLHVAKIVETIVNIVDSAKKMPGHLRRPNPKARSVTFRILLSSLLKRSGMKASG